MIKNQSMSSLPARFSLVVVVVGITDSADLAALMSLKKQWQNTPPNWVKHDPCGRRWEGIYCNGSRVTDIILSGTNLAGPLPEDILSLSELQSLDLSNNRGLMGPLPTNIGSLKNLRSLVLVGCKFSGLIPESIGQLEKLTNLFLSSNQFIGPIPHSIGNLSDLVWLDLSDNLLNGTLPVSNKTTPGLDMLLKAQHFHLGQNRLSGDIPLKLFSSQMALLHIILNDNQLSGTIPDTLGLVRTLKVIRLDRNKLTGIVPDNLNTLTRMSELYLANNYLNGPIPDLTGMNLLAYLDLSNNPFNPQNVPLWFGTLINLTTLRMLNTGLRGNLPTGFFSLPQLQTVVLANNQLNGTVDIPANFSSNLRLLDLRNNSLRDFQGGAFTNSVLLGDNPFCQNPEAAGICKTIQPSNLSNFIPQLNCAPLSCFSDSTLGSDCKRPYLGSLVFRSYNFSDLTKTLYYNFLRDSLHPLLASQVPVDRVCLVSSSVDSNDFLVLNISFFPLGDAFFNRTGVSKIGNILNNHVFDTPYGPYYFDDLTYAAFPGPSKNIGLIIGTTISSFVLLLLAVCAVVYARRQRQIAKQAVNSNNAFVLWNQGKVPQLKGASWFSFEDVKQCTNNFSAGSEIGVGGYGMVYKGKLETGQLLAIKRAKQGSIQGADEFKNEIELLSRVHHRNVVNLIGFCYDKGEQMLVYEFIPNGNLREALSGKSGVKLNWSRRLMIALGAARGLAYLHELADPPIVHRDIKSDNILLDHHLNAKVADFGLSKPLTDHRDHITTQVKGTLGYLDPEYYMTQLLTEKSDVYGFGVVMLELVTGRRPIRKNKYIVREVRETMRDNGNAYSLVDPTISYVDLISLEEFVELAMKCLQGSGEKRPSMGEVVKEIEDLIQANNIYSVYEF
ncbi:leucine-rich repeat receptor protein kinase HPCA1-like [Silene latifolia]|uniref:leucine-rich repeat receptor protein kinase HPCA1-like n=1 Tax=Silene latifolia TaxID=37657 RepID=UPI003D789C1F